MIWRLTELALLVSGTITIFGQYIGLFIMWHQNFHLSEALVRQMPTRLKQCMRNEYTESGGCTYSVQNISFWSMSGESRECFDCMVNNVIHELGHAFYHATGDKALGTSFSRDALRPNPPYKLLWQQHPNAGGIELFADTFIAWVSDAWNTSTDPDTVDLVEDAKYATDHWMDE